MCNSAGMSSPQPHLGLVESVENVWQLWKLASPSLWMYKIWTRFRTEGCRVRCSGEGREGGREDFCCCGEVRLLAPLLLSSSSSTALCSLRRSGQEELFHPVRMRSNSMNAISLGVFKWISECYHTFSTSLILFYDIFSHECDIICKSFWIWEKLIWMCPKNYLCRVK